MGQVVVQSEQTFEAMTPATLTAYKALSFINGDSMAISKGSAVGDSISVSETLDCNNGTIELWVRPNNYGNSGQINYFFESRTDSNNDIRLYKNASNNLVFDVIGNGTTRTCSTSFSAILPFTWNHIVATWSKNVAVNGANYSYVYLNGVGAGQTSAMVAMTSLPSIFYIGSDYNGKQSANGLIAYKITRYWTSAAQVALLYNSGNGSKEFITRSPHVIAMGLTSENSTGVAFVHRGATVSAIVDGATEDTLTVATDATKRFIDDDAVVVNGGQGYKLPVAAYVDGVPSATSLNVDDGADGDAGLLEKVGTNINCARSYYATGGNILNAGTNDFCLSFWVKVTDSSYGMVLSKNIYSTTGYQVEYYASKMWFSLANGGDRIGPQTPTTINDGKWHHYVCTYDRDGYATLYKDGISVATTDISSQVARDLTATNGWALGTSSASPTNNAYWFPGAISDVKVYIGGLWSTAQILYQATHPFDIAGAGTITEAYDLTTGTGTSIPALITSPANNLTLSNALAWSQSAFISRNLWVDGDMRQGGIGAFPTISGAAVTKNATTPISDEQDLKLVNAGASQGYAGQVIPFTGSLYFFGLHKGSASADGASILVSGDGVAAQSMTVTQAGVASGVTNEVEFCFTGDGSVNLDLGSDSVTASATSYWDNIKLFANSVVNGGCEGGADPPASWVQETDATVVSDTSPHAGTNCLKVTAGANNVGASQAVTLVAGQYYTIGGYLKTTAGDTAGLYIDTGDGSPITVGTTTSTTWTRVRISFKATGTNGVVYIRAIANTDIVWADDIWIVRDDTGSVTATKGSGILPENMPALIR